MLAVRESSNEARFVGAEEAAQALGVSVTTLYAYVGRKRIRTQRVAHSRKSQYWWPDIVRVKAREPRAAERVLPDGVTHETKITLMTQQGPYYRGRSSIALADTHSFESVASLLWDVDEASSFSAATFAMPREFSESQKLLRRADPVDKAAVLFPFIERANPRAFDLSRAGMARTGAELLRWYTCLLCGVKSPSDRPIHETLGKAFGWGDELSDLVRRILVLSADHGFEAGTYAVRACAAAGITPYRSVLAGFSVIAGRRSNFGRAESVLRLLKDIASHPDPQEPVLRYLKDDASVPGFGSSFYKGPDPRAQYLMRRYDDMFGDQKEFKKLKRAIQSAKNAFDLEPDFVFANVYGYLRLGLSDRQSLFPLGRCAGWIAHAIEQFEAGETMRLTERYVGRLPD